MKQDLIDLVVQRANGRCEYCRFPDEFRYLDFQIDHVIAEKHGGSTEQINLAWSCFNCNSYKGPNIAGIDPAGDPDVAIQLFHPRRDLWQDHFEWNGPILLGKTPSGRATIETLRINLPECVEVRRLMIELGVDL